MVGGVIHAGGAALGQSFRTDLDGSIPLFGYGPKTASAPGGVGISLKPFGGL